jgi:hypothetical protein
MKKEGANHLPAPPTGCPCPDKGLIPTVTLLYNKSDYIQLDYTSADAPNFGVQRIHHHLRH